MTASTGFSVSIADVASTASAFGRVHDAAARTRDAASASLARTTSMAGDDAVLAAWRGRYDAVARAAWGASGAVAATAHDVATRLTATGNAYLDADHAAMPGTARTPDRLAEPRAPSPEPAGPPTATGHTGSEAPGVRAEYWPGGEPVVLRDASAAWNALAEALDDAAYAADSAFRTLTAHNTGAAFSAMRTFWASRFTPCAADPLFNAAPAGARDLGQACAALADLIDRTRTTVEHAAEDAARDVAPMEAVGAAPHPVGRAAALVARLSEPMMTHAFLRIARRDYLAELQELTSRLSPELEQRLDRAAQSVPAPPPGEVTAADVGEVVSLGLRGSGWDGVPQPHPTPDGVFITPERVGHVLDGDARGGGHLHGVGRPNKSEFPPDWDRDRIVRTALSIARDPTNPPLFQRGKNYDAWKIEATRDGVRMRVVLADDGSLVTVVPLDGPGVSRNPPTPR